MRIDQAPASMSETPFAGRPALVPGPMPVSARSSMRFLCVQPVVTFGDMDGAGGQNRTGYARLFRAALYQ